jgi:hypothetical protein
LGEVDSGYGAIPPTRAGCHYVAECAAISGGGVAIVVEVMEIAAVDAILEVPEVVRLHQGDFIVAVAGIVGDVLVVMVAEFVNVPDEDAAARQTTVAARLLAIFDEVVLGGNAGLLIAVLRGKVSPRGTD